MSTSPWCRHYRRLTAALVLWGLLPLPFTGIVLPPFWLAAVAAAVLLWLRPDAPQRLPGWLQNLVAVAIVAVVVAVGGLRYGPMRPLGHLLLLLIAVRVLSVGDRRSFLRALPAVLLLWVASVASSTHVALVLYLVGSAVGLWWLGMRVHLAGLLEEVGEPASSCRGPRLRHAATAGVAALVLSVPVFVTLPRIRSPWVAAPGSRSVSGFSSAVELQRLGDIRESREVALVARRAGSGRFDPSWARLRGTAFDLVRSGAWAARWGDVTAPDERDGLVWLQPGREGLDGTVEIVVELLAAERYLFLPEGSVALRCALPVAVDPTGGVVLQMRPEGRVSYRVWLQRPPEPERDDPSPGDTFLPPQDPAVTALARQLTTGLTGVEARARAVEDHLRTSYEYTTTGASGVTGDPVAHFLLARRAGHCEFFAGAMVVLLRDLGIPARMVGGYSGGTLGPSGNELLVRQGNAHTWVEVWLGVERGWVSFDPTPAAGIPGVSGAGGLDRLRWAWDRVQVFWDGSVLTFGTGEQLALIGQLGSAVVSLESALRAAPGRWLVVAGAVVVVVVIVGRLARRRSRPRLRRAVSRGPAALALERLARRLQRTGLAVPRSATVRWIARRAAERWPRVAAPAVELCCLAERELYGPGGSAPTRSEVQSAEAALRAGFEDEG